MNWAITLGTVRGIKIRLHWTFLLLVPWAAYNWGLAPQRGWSGAFFGIAIIATVFVFVVLHELAHSLVARSYGVQVREIELSPIGGIAKMERLPKAPSQEFLMALAGPLVNLAIAVPLGLVLLRMVQGGVIRSTGHGLYLLSKPSWQGFILNLFASNLLLGLFNLFPAFPMDGGRILRSILAWRMGPRKGTLWAAYIGQLGAIALGTIGVVTANLILLLIALLVFGAARQEYQFTELQALLGGMPVSQALPTSGPHLSPDDRLGVALDLTMHGHPAPYAVVENGQLAGLLSQIDMTSALETYDAQVRVGDIMRREVPTLSASDTLARAHQVMATSGLRALPVVEEGRFLGMITLQQIKEIHALVNAQTRRHETLGREQGRQSRIEPRTER